MDALMPIIDGQLRLPYPAHLELVVGGEPYSVDGELISVADDGTCRTFIFRLPSMHQDMTITTGPGDSKVETVYDEHGVKWARTI